MLFEAGVSGRKMRSDDLGKMLHITLQNVECGNGTDWPCDSTIDVVHCSICQGPGLRLNFKKKKTAPRFDEVVLEEEPA